MQQYENRFFRIVWRFNALGIAGVAIFSVLLGSYLVYEIFKTKTRERQVTNVVNVGEPGQQDPGQQELKEQYALGNLP